MIRTVTDNHAAFNRGLRPGPIHSRLKVENRNKSDFELARKTALSSGSPARRDPLNLNLAA
jgi:hypothetical protein